MRDLPRPARRFVFLVVLLGFISFAGSIYRTDWSAAPAGALLFFALAAFVSDVFATHVAARGGQLLISSTGGAWMLGASFLFPPAEALVVASTASLASDLIQQRIWYKTAFNAAQLGLAAGLASLTFNYLTQPFTPLAAMLALAGVLAGLVYYFVNTAAVNTAFALATGESQLHVWKTGFRGIVLHNLSTVSLAGLIAILWATQPISVLLVGIPLAAIRLAMHHLTILRSQTRNALLELANILDRRDPTTLQHSERVAEYSKVLAKALRLPADQVDLIYDATRLHDIGKIGMANELLYKPGKFTEEEWRTFKNHPRIGADIVGKFPLFEGAKEIVLHHQERYDGTGYPTGLQGEEIPLGSRIIAVADAFDAMQSDRPYRGKLAPEKIVSELVKGKGTQFDPELVDIFLNALVERGEIARELLPVEVRMAAPRPVPSPG